MEGIVLFIRLTQVLVLAISRKVKYMEIKFTAEQIIGLAVMMNNGTVPFLGLVTILPQGVENVFKWKPSFMFDKVVDTVTEKYKQMGIMESFQFTNLTYTMLKSKYQVSLFKDGKITESIFLAENNTAGLMTFNEDGTYTMKDEFDPKELVDMFAEKAKKTNCKVYLRERSSKPARISANDITEVFNLMHI